jgi:hypothetical protein
LVAPTYDARASVCLLPIRQRLWRRVDDGTVLLGGAARLTGCGSLCTSGTLETLGAQRGCDGGRPRAQRKAVQMTIASAAAHRREARSAKGFSATRKRTPSSCSAARIRSAAASFCRTRSTSSLSLPSRASASRSSRLGSAGVDSPGFRYIVSPARDATFIRHGTMLARSRRRHAGCGSATPGHNPAPMGAAIAPPPPLLGAHTPS